MKPKHCILIPTTDPLRYRIIRASRHVPPAEVDRIIAKADRGISQTGFLSGSGHYHIVYRQPS